MRLYVLARHGQSTLNVSGRINGDPDVPVPLTEAGIANAQLLGAQVRALPIELAVHTRFPRTRETVRRALASREIATLVEPLLDDIDIGTLEGETVGAYRAWKRVHTLHDPFPRGESLADAALRYAEAFECLLARPERVVLVVAHEIPIRYAANAAAQSDSLDGPLHDIPNAAPFLFDRPSLEAAAAGIRRLVSS